MSHNALYITMSGLQANLQRQATISNNISNANTTGFKRAVTNFRALPWIGQGSPVRASTALEKTAPDFSEGPLSKTGNPMDVALKGHYVLTVRLPNGKKAYTRDGALTKNAQGELVTEDGNPVLGRGGAPIVLPKLKKVHIAQDGTISGLPANGGSAARMNPLAHLSVRRVNPKKVKPIGQNLFAARGGGPATTAVGRGVSVLQSGYLEGSNVKPVDQMVNMIQNQRQFQAQTSLLAKEASDGSGFSQLSSIR